MGELEEALMKLQFETANVSELFDYARKLLEAGSRSDVSRRESTLSQGEEICRRLYHLTSDHRLAEALFETVRAIVDGDTNAEASRRRFEARATQLIRETIASRPQPEHSRRNELLNSLKECMTSFVTFRKDFHEVRREAKIDLTNLIESKSLFRWDEEGKRLTRAERWLSHNGMHIPTKDRLSLNAPIDNTVIFGEVALRDALRPDLSLSRDELRSLPWEAYSHVTLAFSRALRANSDFHEYSLKILTDRLKKHAFSLRRILLDSQISPTGAWAKEPILHTEQGKLSLLEIRERLSRGESVSLSEILSIDEFIHQAPDFVRCCAAALIQVGLSVKADPASRKLSVDNPEIPALMEGQMYFPPLFFVPYENSQLLRYGSFPLNMKHPFARWLIDYAAELHERHPGLFESLRSKISINLYSLDENLINQINSAIASFRQIRPRMVPAVLNLKKEEFQRY